MTGKFVCLAATTAVMRFAQAGLFAVLSEFRFERKRCVVAAIIAAALTSVVCIAGSVLDPYDRTVEWSLLSCAVPMLVFFFVISRYRGVRFFATYCVADVSVALVDFFAYLLVLFFFDGNYTIDLVVRSVSMVTWALAIRKIVGDRWRKALLLLKNGWWLILMTIGGMFALVCLLAAYPTPIAQRPADVPMTLLVVAVMVMGMIMGIRMVYTMLTASEQRVKSRFLQNQLTLAENQYAMLSESVDQIRRLRHDMKYHIGVIYGLLQQGDYNKLQEYMRQYYDQLTLLDTSLPPYTKNKTVNILAGYYARQGEEQGIECRMDIRIPEELPFNAAQLTVLLGNMWRNALDACEILPVNSYRFFHTIICVSGNKLVIKCRNSTPAVKRDANGRFVSTKGDGHGNGFASMEAIIGAHNGFSSVSVENGVFTFAAALEIK
jgi:hypothetical protein